MKSGTCKGCGRVILWVLTDKGKMMPLDPDPEKRFVLDHNAPDRVGGIYDTYMPHWATCPQAERFKKK